MAVGVHFVQVGMVPVGPTGTTVDKSVASIKQMLTASTEHRILPDAAVPNSANNPTIKSYLLAEATSNYVLYYMDQYIIVTYNQSDINSV